MPEGDCPYCGVHSKAIQVHKPRCKQNPENMDVVVKEEETMSSNVEVKQINDVVLDDQPDKRKFWQRKSKHTDEQGEVLQPPQDNRTDQDKFLDFFGHLPVWKPKKQGIVRKFFGKGQQFKVCVFVADGKEPRIAYVPVDPSLKILKSPIDNRIFDKTIDGDIAFYNADTFLPLVNSRPVDEIYDVPQHFAQSLYNGGLGEGQAGGLKDLTEQLRQQQFIQKALIAAVVIAALAMFLSTRSYGEAVAQITGFAEAV